MPDVLSPHRKKDRKSGLNEKEVKKLAQKIAVKSLIKYWLFGQHASRSGKQQWRVFEAADIIAAFSIWRLIDSLNIHFSSASKKPKLLSFITFLTYFGWKADDEVSGRVTLGRGSHYIEIRTSNPHLIFYFDNFKMSRRGVKKKWAQSSFTFKSYNPRSKIVNVLTQSS